MAGQSRIQTRRRRRPSKFRLRKPVWVDPFPGIPGTEPEKRLFEALVRHGIYFVFQGDLPEFQKKDLPVLSRPEYKPDFILPEYKVIIDPFGIYHHTLADAIDRDYKKGYLYRAVGYAFYHPWWTAQGWEWNQATIGATPKITRLLRELSRHRKGVTDADITVTANGFTPLGYDTNGVLLRIPELYHGIRFPLKDKADIEAKRLRGYRLGKNLGAGANSVAAANHKRTRPKLITLRTRGRRKRRPTR